MSSKIATIFETGGMPPYSRQELYFPAPNTVWPLRSTTCRQPISAVFLLSSHAFIPYMDVIQDYAKKFHFYKVYTTSLWSGVQTPILAPVPYSA